MSKGDRKGPGNGRSIVIKREEIVEGGGHGGAWKVAYADFVTAMMAFFLLMWLLNATTEDQRKGLADYFSPSNQLSHASSGSGEPFGGHTAFDQGALASDRGAVQALVGSRPTTLDPTDSEGQPNPPPREGSDPDEDQGASQPAPLDALTAAPGTAAGAAGTAAAREGTAAARAGTAATGTAATGAGTAATGAGSTTPTAATPALATLDLLKEIVQPRPGSHSAPGAAQQRAPTEAELQAALERREKAEFSQAAQQIREAVRGDPALADLARQLLIDITPQGLRIQLLDAERQPMFPLGSALPNDRALLLLQKVTPVLARLSQDISIAGHTDATPFPGPGRSNWELSTERANATRRLLVEGGLPDGRIRSVTGNADRDLLLPADPLAAANRRIAIVVLRAERPAAAVAETASPVGGTAGNPAGAAAGNAAGNVAGSAAGVAAGNASGNAADKAAGTAGRNVPGGGLMAAPGAAVAPVR
jgi:chemotaxis protein MotB